MPRIKKEKVIYKPDFHEETLRKLEREGGLDFKGTLKGLKNGDRILLERYSYRIDKGIGTFVGTLPDGTGAVQMDHRGDGYYRYGVFHIDEHYSIELLPKIS